MPAGGVAAHPKGYAQYSILSSATLLTSTPQAGVPLPDGAIVADLVAENQDLRWRDDGVAPTAGVGFPLFKGVPYTYAGDLAKVQFIETAGGGKLNVAYYGL